MSLLGVAVPDGQRLAARRERLKELLEPPRLLELVAHVRVLLGHHGRQLHALEQAVARERRPRKVKAADVRQHRLGDVGLAERQKVCVDCERLVS